MSDPQSIREQFKIGSSEHFNPGSRCPIMSALDRDVNIMNQLTLILESQRDMHASTVAFMEATIKELRQLRESLEKLNK